MSPALPTAPFLLQELLTTNSKSPAFEDVLPGCQHDYYTVPERSVLPQLDERPGASTKWHAEAICRHCRCHLRIAIDFSQSSDPCPTQDYPLHHFRIEEEPGIYDRVQTVNFVCGGPQCKAHVTAEVRAPFLKNADVTSLTSIAALKERIAARARDGYGLEDPGPHTPAMALNTFQSYVRDSLKDNETKRIPTKNRKFMLALGDEASPLLLRLGFAFEPPAPDLNYGHWRLPKAASTSEGVLRLALSDVFDELGALLLQRPEAERVQTEVTIRQPPSSLKDLERTLGCLDYAKAFLPTRNTRLADEILHSYKQLGTLSDYSDDLISFAFDRSSIWNPEASPTLFQHFKNIAAYRHSEQLETRALMLQSKGYLGLDEINSAYQCFNIHPDRAHTYADDQILGIYRSTHADLGQDGQTQAREALRIIGRQRNSKNLENAASNSIETYDEALGFLGADHNTADDFISALVTAKIDESGSNRELAQRSLAIIAETRKSDTLRYESRADASNAKMSLQQAYNILGIPEPDQVDDEMISVTHGVALSENPGRSEELNEALSTVADARNSYRLRNYWTDNQSLANSQIMGPVMTWKSVPLEEPRGLKNIGNTCYLNSLLQYLFAIKPLRELLKDFEKHKEAIEDGKPFSKQIAGIKASRDDVKSAQEFVKELAKLFEDLAETRDTFATPSVNLARLTIREPHKSFQRRMTVSGLPNPTIEVAPPVTEPSMADAEVFVESPRGSMSEGPQTGITEQAKSTARPSPDPEDMAIETPVSDAAGSGNAPQQPHEVSTNDQDMEVNGHDGPHELDTTFGPQTLAESEQPNHETSSANDARKTVNEIEAWARQQDMAEALDNTIRQLQCAIKAEHVDEDGNQHDLISKLFWGKEYETAVKSSTEVAKPIDFKDFIIRVNDNPTDLVESLEDTKFGRDEHSDDFYTYYKIANIPSIVHIRVSRGNFDRERGAMVRNTNRLMLHPVLSFDRYMTDDDMIARRKQSWEYRSLIQQRKLLLKNLQTSDLGMSISETLNGTSEYLQHLHTNAAELVLDLEPSDTTTTIQETLMGEAHDADLRVSQAQTELDTLNEKLAAVFPTQGRLTYRLQAVFVHIGVTVNAGHWVIYIHDAPKGQWRKYNDEDVSIVNMEDMRREVLEPEDSTRGVSAYLAYARETEQDEVFDVVFREPREVGEDAMEGLQGGDAGGSERPAWEQERPAWDMGREATDWSARW